MAMNSFYEFLDSFLIAPYRWFKNPLVGWSVGTFILSGWAVLLGELTHLIVYKINKRYVKEALESTRYYHEQSLRAKEAGDERAYRLINKLSNEEFGRSFFLLLAMGCASLWPAFLAAAWLNERFGHITFLILPPWLGGYEINFIGPFVLLYVLAKIFISRIKVSAKNYIQGNK